MSYSSLFFVAAATLALFLSQSQADFVPTVCSKARNPPLCNRLLRSDPRSSRADLTGLAQIAIAKSRAAVKGATPVVRRVHAPNVRIRGVIDTCVEVFADAVDELRDSEKSLNSGDKQSLNIHASAALDYVGTCADEFNAAGGVPDDVARATKKAGDIIDVILVISDL